jgi:hypothetical protein
MLLLLLLLLKMMPLLVLVLLLVLAHIALRAYLPQLTACICMDAHHYMRVMTQPVAAHAH